MTARDLTPVAGVQAVVIKQSPARPQEIVVGLNDRVAEYHDLYLLNLETGARTLLLENDGFESFVVDDRYRVCFGRLPKTGGGYVLKKREGDGWLEDPFVTVGPEDSLSTFEVGLDAAGETLYLFDSRGRDTAALVALDVRSGDQKVLLADPRADVDQVSSHPTNGRVDMAASTYTRTTWRRALRPALRRDLDALGAITAGDVSILDRTRDNRLWAVAADPGDAPRRFYLYDRDAGQATLLFSDRPALEAAPLRPLQAGVIPAVSYLTLPHAGQRPAEPLPLVLYVHGGPWARDRWGLTSVHQWLANRGYAALSVNFRGSTGFGKAIVNAGDR